MRPLVGWYKRSKWLETFRPGDGKGHITITGGDNLPVDIAFDDICCDDCNADAGVDRGGSEDRIYFDGSNSLCQECGQKAQRRLLVEMVACIKENSFGADSKATDAEVLGLLVAHFFQWDGVAILRAAQFALEDANFHGESARVAAMADAVEKASITKPSAPEKRSQGGSR